MRAVIGTHTDARRYLAAVRWMAGHMAQRTKTPAELAACAELVAAIYCVGLLQVLSDVGAECAERLGVAVA